MNDQIVIPGPDGSSGGMEDNDDPAEDQLDVNYLFDLQQMVRDLESNDDIVQLDFEIYDQAPEVSINMLETGVGVSIPDEIKAFYKLTDGFELSWDFEIEDTTYRGGRTHLFGFSEVFDVWLDELWSLDSEDPALEEDFLLSLRGFDRFSVAEDLTDWIVICVEEEYPTFDLFLYDEEKTAFYLLNLTFREYLERLLETRGFFGWQYLFLEDDLLVDGKQRRRRVETFFECMENHFPFTDLTSYRQRLDVYDIELEES